MIYNIAVIGKGLFGSAAAKYAQVAGNKTILIGPEEPTESEYPNSDIFSSHYDAGRVARRLGQSIEWTRYNNNSLDMFPKIKADSGIDFYGTEGFLFVSSKENIPHFKSIINQNMDSLKGIQLLDYKEIKENFPHFNFPIDVVAYLEKENSGHLKPRSLINAQLKIFKSRGGVFLSQAVTKINSRNNLKHIITKEGSEIYAEKVIICTGAFHNFFDFNTFSAPLILKSETILLAELGEKQALQLQNLPSLIYDINTDEYNEIYLVKPLLYPDGKYYLKIGANLSTDKYLSSLKEIKDWFCSKPSIQQKELYQNILLDLIPSLQEISFKTKHCIIERTKTRTPYFDNNGNNIFTCTGGNGYGAMCSDAIGKTIVDMAIEK